MFCSICRCQQAKWFAMIFEVYPLLLCWYADVDWYWFAVIHCHFFFGCIDLTFYFFFIFCQFYHIQTPLTFHHSSKLSLSFSHFLSFTRSIHSIQLTIPAVYTVCIFSLIDWLGFYNIFFLFFYFFLAARQQRNNILYTN